MMNHEPFLTVTTLRQFSTSIVPELLVLAQARGLPTLPDSSGEGLRQGVIAVPRIIKVNRAEALLSKVEVVAVSE